MKIAYVILHYMAGKDTIECAESILAATKDSIHDTYIVIINNGSTNTSYSKIQEAFSEECRIITIHNDENVGFACGNNIGFLYAKNVIKADFIALLNNDTIIQQHDFNEKIVEKYEKYHYGVLGPDIVTLDKCHQNPGRAVDWSNTKLMFFRAKKMGQFILAHFEVFDRFLTLNENSFPKERVDQDRLNVQLHGACLIFSEVYISRFDGLCDKTFLYMEEDILKLRADYYNYLMMYSPELAILHKEDIATNMVAVTSIEKKKRVYYNLLKSSKVYKNLKKQYNSGQAIRNVVEAAAQRFKGTDYKLDKQVPISYLVGLGTSRLVMLLRGYIKQGFKSYKKVFCGKNVKLKCIRKIEFHDNVTIQNGVYLDALSTNGVYLGKGSSIGSGTIIRCSGNFKTLGKGFHLGAKSSLADNCFVGATGGVWIGNDVIGGQNIRFHSSNHNFHNSDELIRKQGITAKGIIVEDNCWIGAGVVFCDGVTIGEGCVIGTNSVITKDFPKNSIIAGIPAKIIGQR